MTQPTLKTNWETEKNQKLLARYLQLNLIPFSCKLVEELRKDENGEMVPKKRLLDLPTHSAITKYDRNLVRTFNGLCLKMGTKLDDDSHVLLVDVDNKNGTVEKWNDLLKKHHKTTKLKTPTATTGNDGLHYLFKVSDEQFQKLKSSYTKLQINGETLDIDVKAKNQLQLAEPTKYTALDGSSKKYQWINDSIYKHDIRVIPNWLFDAIVSSSTTTNTARPPTRRTPTAVSRAAGTPNTNYQKLTMDLFRNARVKPSQEDLDYWNLLSFERLDNGKTWIDIGFLCYSLYDEHTGFLVWDHLSKLSSKYNSDEVKQKWTASFLGKPKKCKMGSLIHYAREDNKEEAEKIRMKYWSKRQEIKEFLQKEDPFTDDNADNHFVEQRYLLDKEKKLEDDSVVCQVVNNFFSGDASSLNLRSPYDTGKTQLMKEILTKYQQKRVLWVSTRIAYTYDIMKNFQQEHGFIDYTSKNFGAKRLVIQIESFLKLRAHGTEDGKCVGKFDLIVLDEVESILKQFSSEETFKNTARETYDYFHQIIRTSIRNGGKIVSMDGDLGNRAMHFLGTYGRMTNLINRINFNTFKLQITSDRNHYENQIFESLSKGQNIVIPTMSAGYANQLHTDILQKFPGLNIKIYTSTCGGEEKKKLKNVDDEWKDANVLIYSPTISAGVSFDQRHFHRMFGVICSNSCTERETTTRC
jgi:hypothetical protein